MGGKNSTSTSQVSIPPEVLARYNAVNARAENVAQTPFQSYPGQFVAGLTGSQQAGIQNTNAMVGAAQPFINAGAGLTLGSAQDLQPEQYSDQSVGKYMSPFLSNVYDTTAANIDRSNAVQQQGMLGDSIKANAFGGDRAGIARAELARTQNLAGQQTLAGILQQGFTGAQGEFNNQQQINLGADQNTAARMAAAGNSLGSLGVQGQQAGLAGAAAQMQAGQVEQGTQQADLTAQYNQFLQDKSYPFQVAQFLANIAMGTGALSGSTTTSTSPAPFFSDERLKENITPVGKTFDGQTIHRYNYVGDPRTQIGLLAQDVAHHAPHAVGQDRGYLTVDYDQATRRAAGLGAAAHKASGGLAIDPYAPLGQGQGGNFPRPMSYVPQAVLPVAGLATAKVPEQKQSTGLADAAKGAAQFTELAKSGKGAWDWMTKPSDADVAAIRNTPMEGEFADGGDVSLDQPDYPDAPEAGKGPDVKNYVPKADLPVAGLHPADAPKPGGGGGGLGDIASIASSAAKMLPYFMASRGGAIGHYADGGAPADPYADDFAAAEAATGIPAKYLRAQAQTESSMNPNATGKAGEVGLIQVMPSTARDPGFGMTGVDPATLKDPHNNIMFAAQYLKARGQHAGVQDWSDPNQWAKGLRAYNGGGDPNYVQKAFRNAGLSGAAPDAPRVINAPPQAVSAGLSGAAPSGQQGGFGRFLDRVKTEDADGDNMKLSLLSGLFGMLSSKSHWLVPAIGEGGQQAIQTYQGLRKNDAAIEEQNARARDVGMDAMRKGYVDTPAGRFFMLADGRMLRASDYRGEPLLGTVPASEMVTRRQGATPPVPAPGSPSSAVKPPAPAPAAPAAPAAGTAAQPNQPNQPNAPAPAPGTTGLVFPPPQVEGLHPKLQKAAAAERELAVNGGPDFENAKATTDTLRQQTDDEAKMARESQASMKDLAGSIASLPADGTMAGGTGAAYRASIGKTINTVLRIAGIQPVENFETAAAANEVARKLATLQANASRGDLNATRALEMFQGTVPSIDMTPEAAAKMAAQMYMRSQQAIDKNNDFKRYTTASNGLAKNFEPAFSDAHSTAEYAKEKDAIEHIMQSRTNDGTGDTYMKMIQDGRLKGDKLRRALKRDFPDVPGLYRYFEGGSQR